MRNLILFLFFLMCFDAFSGNPVMFVRCRSGARIVAETTPCSCDPGFVLYDPYGNCMHGGTAQIEDNHSSRACYPAPAGDDGRTCPDGMVLDSFMITLQAQTDVEAPTEWIYLCVPDCDGVTCSDPTPNLTSNCPTASWDLEEQQCGCNSTFGTDFVNEKAEEIFSTFIACGCPTGFTQDIPTCDADVHGVDPNHVCANIDFNENYPCIILEVPEGECYDGDVSFYIEPFTCESTDATAVVTIVITGDGMTDFAPGQIVTIDDLENCDLTTDDNFLLALEENYGATAAFEADENGEIIIEFTRDPTQESVIDFGVGDITIPACSGISATLDSEDPCACDDPLNVLNSAGDAILFWHDVLTVRGTPGAEIQVSANNNPTVFLKSPSNTDDFEVGDVLGTIQPNFELKVDFYRDASNMNQALDIEYQDVTNGTIMMPISGTDMSSCDLTPVPCVADPIPTLSQWSLMILGMLLLILGLVGYRVNQLQTQKEKL